MTIDLRLGRWQDVLADVHDVDTVIADPPYSERTHKGQRHGRKDERYGRPDGSHLLSARGLDYDPWTPADVSEFVLSWHPRTRGWICALTDSELYPAWRDCLRTVDRYVFAPIACVQHAMNVRLAGDGPSNWTTWLVVARPRPWPLWGALPGAYVGSSHDTGENALDRSKRACAGGKPLWLMRAIVRNYSRPGDLVCDPCAGGATTLIASALEGCNAIGAEMDPKTYAKAQALIARGFTPVFPGLTT
jgi:site-specific DNA-methyltransferase (adenine-specific)